MPSKKGQSGQPTSRAASRINGGLFSSATDEWGTPQDLFDKFDHEFHFTVDPCSTHENAKCAKYYTRAEDGLKQDWSGETVFMNPPYGREISNWMEKAYRESLQGATVVCLVPARTDTAWWHNYAMKGEIRFLRGRVKFRRAGSLGSAPFPSAVVIFRPKSKEPGVRDPAAKPASVCLKSGDRGSPRREANEDRRPSEAAAGPSGRTGLGRRPGLLSVANAAERCDVSVRTVYRWLNDGLVCHRLPGAGARAIVRISREDLDQWLGRFRHDPAEDNAASGRRIRLQGRRFIRPGIPSDEPENRLDARARPASRVPPRKDGRR